MEGMTKHGAPRRKYEHMKIAEPTIERIVQYHRLLKALKDRGQSVVSSQEIGDTLSFKASQVRKDLSYFGEIGKRGVGYNVDRLYGHIDRILDSPEKWRIALAGVGNLGEALLGYKAFRSDKHSFRALFDVDPEKIGKTFRGIPCYDLADAPAVMAREKIDVLVLTVPAEAAQKVLDIAAASGTLKGVLNFSPVSLSLPDGVLLCAVDISVELEKLLFYLKHWDERK